MKFLVLIAVLAIAYLLWRQARLRDRSGEGGGDAAKPSARKPAAPQDMVRCPACSLHLPRSEAIAGPDGQMYCSREHVRLPR